MATTPAVLRPDGVAVNTGWTASGAATLNAATSDNTDASFANCPGFPTSGLTLELTMGTVAIPALAQIRSVTPRSREGGGTFTQTFQIRAGGTLAAANVVSGGPTTTYTGATLTLSPDGDAWTQADIDSLQYCHRSSNLDSASVQVYEAYIDVLYNEAPVASAVGVSSNLTARPPVIWTYTDPESDAQERYRVKVYQGTGTIADPDNTPAYYDSGEVFSSSASHTLTSSLLGSPTGVSYRVYVKVADVGSNGRYGNWATATFSIVIDVPATPEVFAWAEPSLARIGVTVQGHDNGLQYNPADFEGFGGEWVAITNCAVSRQTTQVLHGVGALQLSSSAAGTMSAGNTGYRVAVVPGRLYNGMVSMKSAVNARNIRLDVQWYTVGGAVISTVNGLVGVDNTTGWTQLLVAGMPPATAASAALIVSVFSTAAASEIHYLDQAFLGPVPVRNMLTFNQQSLAFDTTGWLPYDANATIARSTAQAYEGAASLAITAVGVALAGAKTPDAAAAMPVAAGQTYNIALAVRAATTSRTVTFEPQWWTSAGAFISNAGGGSVSDSNSAWTLASGTATAPATAAFMSIRAYFTGVAGETHYVDYVRVTVANINLLTPNEASLETDTSGWAASVNSTIARSTAQFLDGAASLSLTSVAAGTMSAQTPVPAAATPTIAVAPSTSHTITIWTKAATVARSVNLQLNWYTAAFGFISSSLSTPAANSTSIWTPHTLVVTAPATAAYVQVIVTVAATAAGGEVHYADSMLVAQTADVTWGQGDFAPIGTYVIVEKSIDGGTTWTQVRGAFGWNVTTLVGSQFDAAATQQYTVYDYELVRNVSALYRARVTEQSGKVSPNVQAAASLSIAATGWWLKDPLSPGLNVQLDVQPGFAFRQKEPQTVYEPLGRNVSVVVTDGVKGIEGSLTVWSKDATRYAKLRSIIGNGRSLWLEDNFGRAWYVKVSGAAEWSLLRAQPQVGETTPLRHLHSVALPFVEVGSPTGDTVTAGTPTG